jgi:nicotinamide-nucleotide amidase
MYAEIISIGHEILMGEIVDTNAQYLASRLPSLGYEVRWMHQVGDNMNHLVDILKKGLERSDLILTTGGLGPTADDLTRESIGAAVDEELYIDPEQLEILRGWFLRRGREMPIRNTKQAHRIASASVVPNPVGTAPGWWVEKNGKIVAAMPGPPQELQVMWENETSVRLRGKITPVLGLDNPYVGVYAKFDGIHVRIIATGDSDAAARRLLEPTEARIRELLEETIWGIDDESPEERVGELLKQKGLTLSVMESCSGGLLAEKITDVPGASSFFVGGIVSYATEVKIASGVDPAVIEKYGVISAETALAMAEAVRTKLNTDVGIGVTGVAGPDSMDDKLVGEVHIGIVHPGGTRTISGSYPPRRHLVRNRAAVGALLGLWQELRELQ